ncbi:hypothetical protein F511_21447 [Dorcoceras hygrometricum]|uniref:Homeobox-leucine zipper protein n=1 Tax=Dorcoceras hygrometricum TaxID=472368 RepID=A0A2Z7CAH9_9LAMI|nr:hypothetical protein F511_21447 [Dorcoceras hygrometricum]
MEALDQKAKSQEKKRIKNDRRFSDEQIKSLESIFDQETKLESRKKMQLARDLGLQPRQVAIWFQNRRARWKARQIEQEYKVLKANYDNLYLHFDHLKKENESLQRQLQELSGVEKNLDEDDLNDHRVGGGFQANIPNDENISKPFGKVEDREELVCWDEDEVEISHLASPQTWDNLCSDGLFEQSLGITQNCRPPIHPSTVSLRPQSAVRVTLKRGKEKGLYGSSSVVVADSTISKDQNFDDVSDVEEMGTC